MALVYRKAVLLMFWTGFLSLSALASGIKPLSGQRRTKALPAAYYTGRPETIEETAELVTARGGKGIAVVVDHLDVSQVEKLVAEIRAEQGKLHVLVNDISESAEHEFGKTFWQADLERGFAMFRNAIHTHIITSHCAAPLLIETAKNSGRTGLIVEIGD